VLPLPFGPSTLGDKRNVVLIGDSMAHASFLCRNGRNMAGWSTVRWQCDSKGGPCGAQGRCARHAWPRPVFYKSSTSCHKQDRAGDAHQGRALTIHIQPVKRIAHSDVHLFPQNVVQCGIIQAHALARLSASPNKKRNRRHLGDAMPAAHHVPILFPPPSFVPGINHAHSEHNQAKTHCSLTSSLRAAYLLEPLGATENPLTGL
jgi:hypothetical protein